MGGPGDGSVPSREHRGLDIYIVLSALIAVAALLTWIIPAGRYERTVLPDGREAVVPGSYQVVERSPAGFMDVITAIPDGLADAASVVFLVFLVAGSVGVMRRAGILDLGVNRLTAATGRRVELLIPALMFAFSAVSGVVGMPELSIAYLPIVQPLLVRLGCGPVTGTAVALLPTTLGAAFGVTVPATVGIGHMLAGLPMFSGASYRFVFFLIIQTAAAIFVVRRARREIARRNETEEPRPTAPAVSDTTASVSFSGRQKAAGIVALGLFAGVCRFGSRFAPRVRGDRGRLRRHGGCRLAVGGSRGPNQICSDFNDSFREILVGALVCGVARGVSVVMTEGMVMDTVVYGAALLVSSLPPALTAVGVLFGQTAFNFLVPSGSGQALITLPILVPVADLAGVTRQVVVLATQWGDGITNVIFPTSGYFMATLVMARVGLLRWIRYYLPLFGIILLVATGGLVVAQYIELGPF